MVRNSIHKWLQLYAHRIITAESPLKCLIFSIEYNTMRITDYIIWDLITSGYTFIRLYQILNITHELTSQKRLSAFK